MIGCWGLTERDISCDGLEKEMVLLVLELWWRNCVKKW